MGLKWLQLPARVKVVAYVAGGKPIVEDIENEFVIIDPDLISILDGTCGLKVRGDSMVASHILNGDILICRKAADPARLPKGTIVVVDLKGERGATVKRWEFKKHKGEEGGTIYLSSDQYASKNEILSFESWEVGKVFEIVGLLRQVK